MPVETIWLDALEHVPSQTVVVFTTNQPARLRQRFRNRCEEHSFQGGSDRLKSWIDALARRLSERERAEPMPDLDSLGMPTLGDAGSMTAGIRLLMGRPRRIDNPTKITLLLSAACHEQLEQLCEHFENEPTRRTQVSKSEVVEKAVAALHLAIIHARARSKK